MTTTRSALTDADIRVLVKGAEPEERALIAHRLCRHMDRAGLTDDERAEAHRILRVLARDAAEQVRRALAVTLKASPLVPRDVANRLARDIESIAVPVLNFSPVFSDEDLAEIVRIGGPVRQGAVARRPVLTETVTDAIAEFGAPEAVRTAGRERGRGLLRARACRPPSTASRPPRACWRPSRCAAPAGVGHRAAGDAGHRRAARAADQRPRRRPRRPRWRWRSARASGPASTWSSRPPARPTCRRFVAHLRRGQRLTASLLLRGLAHGHMSFFEWGLAELSGVPHHRTWLMVHDAGELGLRAIYERAGLPARLLPAFRAAVDAYHSMEFDGGPDDMAALPAPHAGTVPQPAASPSPARTSTGCSTRSTS